MTNRYEVSEVTEIGNAKDLILGTQKGVPILPDGPAQERRSDPMSDDE